MPRDTQPQRVLDTFLAAWVVAWAVLGLWVALEVRHLGDARRRGDLRPA